MLRKNSLLRRAIGEPGVEFLEFATQSISRLLPHTETSAWAERPSNDDSHSIARWTDTKHRGIELRLVIAGTNRQISAKVRRRRTPRDVAETTLDGRELDISKLVVVRICQVLRRPTDGEEHLANGVSLHAIRSSFDEELLAEHLRSKHKLELSVADVLRAMHQLSEQTYENSALAFGCIVAPRKGGSGRATALMKALVRSKKYRALTDGFRTAYEISRDGRLLRFVSLSSFKKALGGHHYSPEWTEMIANAATENRISFCLTRNGDLLLFAQGSMTFAYRYGQWKFWNHSHLIRLLRALARVQRVSPKIVGAVVSAVYRAALDVAFRRTGALFLILKNQMNLRRVAREEDQIGNERRDSFDAGLDKATVVGRKIQSLEREILAELASLDGAVVISNQGDVLSYGAVLRPRKQGKLKGSEGSRTKAAIGASHYGLAIKVSSDGDITVYSDGKEFLRM